MTWTQDTEDKILRLLENMVASGTLAASIGIEASPKQIVEANQALLMEVIVNGLPLSKLVDASDLVVHAEGPGVRDDSYRLGDVNWLTSTAERQLKRLSAALFDLSGREARRFGRVVDLRLTGLVHGSLYAGFALEDVPANLFSGEQEPVLATIRDAIRSLPLVPSFIESESVSAGIREAMPDAAQRDASMEAALGLSPTGHRGIHTLEMSSPVYGNGQLSQRERVVLRDALRRPELTNRKRGTFVGEVREVDLDARRFHLRDVKGVGTVRCVLEDIDTRRARSMLGSQAQVTGEYESDRSGRPRLMLVSDINLLPPPEQLRIE